MDWPPPFTLWVREGKLTHFLDLFPVGKFLIKTPRMPFKLESHSFGTGWGIDRGHYHSRYPHSTFADNQLNNINNPGIPR
ncbi:hypothetical protein TNCV_1949441 [Trichonephila clavipes]|nr:hypothetical protein TNCV_1949441 [Trichonephila clavipes]